MMGKHNQTVVLKICKLPILNIVVKTNNKNGYNRYPHSNQIQMWDLKLSWRRGGDVKLSKMGYLQDAKGKNL